MLSIASRSATRTSEDGANILITNVVGIVIGVLLLSFGIASVLHLIQSSHQSRSTSEIIEVANVLEKYHADYGVYPGPKNTENRAFFSNTTYFPVAPNDPECGPQGSAACSTNYSMYWYTVNGTDQYYVYDYYASPTKTLDNLYKGVNDANGFHASGVKCADTCTHLMYTSETGLVAW